jgi:hypothetical protein
MINAKEAIELFMKRLRTHYNLECSEMIIKEIYDRILKDTIDPENTKLYSFTKQLASVNHLKGFTDIDGNIYLNMNIDVDPTTNQLIQHSKRKTELLLLFLHIHELGHRIRVYACSSFHRPNCLQYTPPSPGEAGFYLTDTLF